MMLFVMYRYRLERFGYLAYDIGRLCNWREQKKNHTVEPVYFVRAGARKICSRLGRE